MKVGFIGLGKMGLNMARNLANASTDLVVYDLNQEAVSTLVENGATSASSVAELTSQTDVIFTSLPGPPQIEEVALGANGILAHAKPGLAVYDLSTSSYGLTNKLHQAFAEKGVAMLDAPISGGPAGAASRDLVVWVGGDEATFDKHVGIIGKFANHPKYVGPIGAGTVTKLSHNLLGFMIMLAEAEVFSMGVKAGIDPLNLWEALRLGVVGKQSPLNMLTKQFLPGSYETPAMMQKLAHKDVTLATSLAKELGVPMRLATLTLEEMTEALGRGWGEWDSRAFLQLQVQRAGVEIAVDPSRIEKAVAAG